MDKGANNMGLFSSSSKSSSKTYYTDNSKNISADFSTGELGGEGARNNIVATGDVYYAGMSDDLATNFLNAVNTSANTIVDGSLELTNTVLDAGNQLFNDMFDWVQETIGSVAQQTDRVTSALANAYNSEQATHSAFKTYALYGLIGFLGWAYFVKRK